MIKSNFVMPPIADFSVIYNYYLCEFFIIYFYFNIINKSICYSSKKFVECMAFIFLRYTKLFLIIVSLNNHVFLTIF